jgi:hypothetical protein
MKIFEVSVTGQRIPAIDVTLMLLGPRKKLALRRKVKKALVNSGYPQDNIVIMEDIKDEDFVYNKFGRILKKYSPKLFFSFFHENVPMDGVIFELGWLCGKYSRQKINKRLRIIAKVSHNWMHTTRYIQSLFLTAQLLPIEKMNTQLLSRCISNNIVDSLETYRKKSPHKGIRA